MIIALSPKVTKTDDLLARFAPGPPTGGGGLTHKFMRKRTFVHMWTKVETRVFSRRPNTWPPRGATIALSAGPPPVRAEAAAGR